MQRQRQFAALDVESKAAVPCVIVQCLLSSLMARLQQQLHGIVPCLNSIVNMHHRAPVNASCIAKALGL